MPSHWFCRTTANVRLLTQKEAVRQAQVLVRQHIGKDRSLVDELLAERREETGFGQE